MARLELAITLFSCACTFVVESPCDEASCTPFACSESGYCELECRSDQQCAFGYLCEEQTCVVVCVDEDCPHGFKCDDELNQCDDRCVRNDECRDGYYCCDDRNDPCFSEHANECRRE